MPAHPLGRSYYGWEPLRKPLTNLLPEGSVTLIKFSLGLNPCLPGTCSLGKVILACCVFLSSSTA